jgi:hypothetical protein
MVRANDHFLVAQSHLPHFAAMSDHEHEDLPLKQSEAEFRSAHVSGVTYNLTVKLTKDKTFSGIIQIKFEFKETSEPVFLDFKGTVNALKVNGKTAEEPAKAQNANRVNLSGLVAGSNHVEIDFTCEYSHTGEGASCCVVLLPFALLCSN